MMVTAKIASDGQKAMRKLMRQSAAKQVFWPMTAGRYHTKPPGLIEAVNYASVAATKFHNAVKDAGLRLADGKYILVCVNESGKITPSELAFPPGYEESYALELMKRILNNKWSVIGVAFCLLDREAG